MSERDVWADPRPGDGVQAGPGYGHLHVRSVTERNVMATNLVRLMLGGRGARRRIPREQWEGMGKWPGAAVKYRAEEAPDGD